MFQDGTRCYTSGDNGSRCGETYCAFFRQILVWAREWNSRRGDMEWGELVGIYRKGVVVYLDEGFGSGVEHGARRSRLAGQ